MKVWLCQGCNYAPKAGVIDGRIDCVAAKEVVDAIPHTKYRRFESCPHRQNLQAGFLQELAKRCRQEKERSNTDLSPARVARIEAELRQERGMKPL